VSRVGCVLLAAGRSRRYGRSNKLLAPFRGQPLLWWALDAACGAHARPIVIVTGHERSRIEHSLQQYRRCRRHCPRWILAFNRRFRQGLATSLQSGLHRLPADTDGAVVLLGDMPGITPRLIDALCAALQRGDDAVVPVADGLRGNPVLLGRPLFARAMQLRGDQGARRLLANSQKLRKITTEEAIALDIDRRRDLLRSPRRFR
jgi:molybdenum cofactor cytidylyltransferase